MTTIAELQAAGMTFGADEAVAIAQQLISALRDPHHADEVRPPYGPPSPDNVYLNDDGSVVCLGSRTTPAVSEVGIFLEALLPAGSPRVPGGLRYTIARALLNVDVPPFDSLDDLARDLARHEHGSRAAVVRGVLARAAGREASAMLSLVERRRARASASELRRALREADARLFEQQREPRADPVIDLIPSPVPPPQAPRGRHVTAAAACLAAGVALVCTGEFMHRREAPVTVTQTTAAAPIVSQGEPRPALERGVIAVRDVPSTPTRARRQEPRRISGSRPARARTIAVSRRSAARPFDRAQGRPPSRGVLDRLRLGWLRSAFTLHADL